MARIRLAATVLWLTACHEPSQVTLSSPFASAREARELRARIAGQEMEYATLPEARAVAQSHQRIGFHGQAAEPAWIQIDLGRSYSPEEIILFPARVSDPAPDDPVSGFPPEIRLLMSDESTANQFQNMAYWQEDVPGSRGDLPFLRLPVRGVGGRFLRLEMLGGSARGSGHFFTLGEIVVLQNGMNLALGALVTASRGIINPPRWAPENLTDGFFWCGNLHGTTRASFNGFHSRIESDEEAVPKWVEVDLGQTFELDEIRLVPARPADFADVTGFGFPSAFRVLLDAELKGSTQPETILFASDPNGFPNPGDAAVCIRAKGRSARHVRVQADRLWQRSGDYIFALAELQVWSGGKNVALGQLISFSDTVERAASWEPTALVDGFASQRELLSWADWLDGVSRRVALERSLAAAKERLIQLDAVTQKSAMNWGLALLLSVIGAGTAIIVLLYQQQRRARQHLRESISRDLHDEIGSQLSHLALLAENGNRDSLPVIASGARELQLAMRDLVWLLDSGSGDARDFSSRLRTTCRQLLSPAIQEVEIVSNGRAPAIRLPLDWTRQVLLLIREAVTNTARHSGATEVQVQFDWTPTTLIWTLRDNGQGFDEAAPGFQAGAGLRNLRHRAQTLKAQMTLESRPGRGTLIRLQCPLPKCV